MRVRRRSRREFLGLAAAVGAVAAACGAPVEPAPPHTGASVTPGFAPTAPAVRTGLTGAITVSYADELGKKPAYVERAAEAVRARHPAATVRIDHQKIGASEYYPRMLAALRAGDGPDVLHAAGDRIGELADAGLIVPLDDFLRDWPDWQYYPPWVRSSVTYRGRVWGIPYGLDTRFLYYRRDVFARAGLPASWQPKDVWDILATAGAVRARVADTLPYALYAGQAGDSGTATHGFLPLLWAFGGDLQDGSGRWIGLSPALRKTLTFYARAYQGERLVSPDLLSAPRPWTTMRSRLGDGGLALLFEGGWVYGGWADKDKAGTERNVGYLLFPTERSGPSFTVGGAGTCWYVTSLSRSRELAWEYIAAWNTKETVALLNVEDPHPVARIDAVRLPEYRREPFLVHSTNSLEKARFLPVHGDYPKVITAIQRATGRVASGESDPEEAARGYEQDLLALLGAANVVSQG
ncbi:MAG: extracellular solute-binding protein [Dehalococcoidia bacterium]